MRPFTRLPRPTWPSSPRLRGGAGHGEVDAVRGLAVGRVHVDIDGGRSGGLARGLERQRTNAPLRGEVISEVAHVPAHDRTGDRESKRRAGAHAHHLDVLADLGVRRPGRRSVQSPLDGEHGALERIERREADAERGVIGERDARGALPLEERDEVGRARPDQRVDAHVPLGIERGQVRAQPRAARPRRRASRPAPSRRARSRVARPAM